MSQMFTTPYKIRNAAAADFPALAAVEMTAGQIFYDQGIIAPSDDHTVTAEKFTYGFSCLVEADDKDTDASGAVIAGFIQLVWVDRFLHIEELSVHPDHQKQGIGAALIAHALDLARQRDALGVTLSTFRDVSWNGPYYEKLGFEEISAVGLGEDYTEMREEEHTAGLDITARCLMIYHL